VILAGDVGATKILLEVGEVRSARWSPALARRYLIAEHADFEAVLAAFLAEWNAVKAPRARIAAGAIGVAGPAAGNRVKMTHRPWVIDGGLLARRFGIARVEVVNDLAAAAHGIELLAPKDYVSIQPGRAVRGDPQVLLGVGTGLGIAYRIGGRVVPGEGGHGGFSPASAEQAHAWRTIFDRHGRVEAEDVASGRGIANLYHALSDRDAETAWICNQAIEHGDAQCTAALDLFAECLGNVAGDHALAVMARGGIFLAGGVVARIAPSIRKERFRAAFCAKSAMSSLLMRVPVRAIANERLAVLGAARIAARVV
jgi:glucokinase